MYGAPLSGKTSWVNDNKTEGDLIIDMDSIWECISGCDRYIKPKRLNAVAFKVRDTLLDCVKYRLGKWDVCYLIGGFPLQAERERLIKELGARDIFIEATKEECLSRLDERSEEWSEYIEQWFSRYIPPM